MVTSLSPILDCNRFNIDRNRSALGTIDGNVLHANNLRPRLSNGVAPKEQSCFGSNPKSEILLLLSNEIENCISDILEEINGKLQRMESFILTRFSSSVIEEVHNGLILVQSAITDNGKSVHRRYDLMIESLSKDDHDCDADLTPLEVAELHEISSRAAIKASKSHPF
ncbi:hypothetical protein QAD02_017791 [Eretmocerus hayati]|uniref:Uncharacterized protein n=1 Tax=Eretmocerus hayati TaxID=131215 RepID=A0ACC2PEK5_9HYME|nr:hypothetical protein QAD02_017791 [Eretmocerus hayati]